MTPTKLIVTVAGGVVQAIAADRAVEILLVDCDSIAQGDRPGVFPATVEPDRVRACWQRWQKGDVADCAEAPDLLP